MHFDKSEDFAERFERGLRGGSAPQPPASPLWKRGLDPLNKCSITERTAMDGCRLKCSGVGENSF